MKQKHFYSPNLLPIEIQYLERNLVNDRQNLKLNIAYAKLNYPGSKIKQEEIKQAKKELSIVERLLVAIEISMTRNKVIVTPTANYIVVELKSDIGEEAAKDIADEISDKMLPDYDDCIESINVKKIRRKS